MKTWYIGEQVNLLFFILLAVMGGETSSEPKNKQIKVNKNDTRVKAKDSQLLAFNYYIFCVSYTYIAALSMSKK